MFESTWEEALKLCITAWIENEMNTFFLFIAFSIFFLYGINLVKKTD